MVKLGVNIDHVATVRNARGEIYPNPYEAALIAKKSGAKLLVMITLKVLNWKLQKKKGKYYIPQPGVEPGSRG